MLRKSVVILIIILAFVTVQVSAMDVLNGYGWLRMAQDERTAYMQGALEMMYLVDDDKTNMAKNSEVISELLSMLVTAHYQDNSKDNSVILVLFNVAIELGSK